MTSICLYFQVHQPRRLNQNYNFFQIGAHQNYDDEALNESILNRVCDECYLPANELILNLINSEQGNFRLAYSISGMALDQFEKYRPDVIESFQALAATGCVEFLNETYYHSLSSLFSEKEFLSQVKRHRKKIESLFGQRPKTFRNTELIYNDRIAELIEEKGYELILAEGANQLLGWKSPNFVYQPASCEKINLLLKNYSLSDDIAFRYSDQSWSNYPLTSQKYADWLHQQSSKGEVINLFMDYETFGEHHKKESGIFAFLKGLPRAILSNNNYAFHTPAEIAKLYQPVAKLQCPFTISWADQERDATAWVGNSLQDSAIEYAYSLEKAVKNSKCDTIKAEWRNLLCSDHFYYMCTKWYADGEVHQYFNPFKSPYDAYVTYINILNDLRERLRTKGLKVS